MKVEVAVLHSPSLIVFTQELCESRGGRSGLARVPKVVMVSVDAKQHGTDERSEFRSCVEVEVDVLGSPSLIVRTLSVDVKQH